MSVRRILFLATGGTFGMSRRRGNAPLEPVAADRADLSFLDPLRDLAHIDARAVVSIDSSDMTPELWCQLAGIIYAEIDAYDGFVILHGTDTMAYTATALSFMLKNLPRPVILTGSQRPMAELRSDADANLVHSTHCAALDLPEVGIYFGEALFRGNRATKGSVQSYSAFSSPNHPPLVEMGVDIVARSLPLRPQGPFELQPGFCVDVAALSVFPGQQARVVDQLVAGGARGVVLRGFGEGNLPQRGWPEAVERAVLAGVPVVVGTQCAAGRVTPGRYRNSALLRDAGATFSADMTHEAAVVKTMWLLGQGVDEPEFKRRFLQPVAGECSPEPMKSPLG